MDQEQLKKLSAPPNSWHMIRALGGIGIFCALLIALTYQFTLPVIKKNKAEALEKAIFKVLPGAQVKLTFKLGPDNTLEQLPEDSDEEGNRIHAGYDSSDKLVGIAIEAQGKGFQDVLRIIYGYSPEKQAIIGLQVLESKETPGLGDKIEKDSDFLANFNALDVSLNSEKSAIANPIETVKKGSKSEPWQIDAITGATISSKAIGQILRESTVAMLPAVVKNLTQLEEKGQIKTTRHSP